MEQKNTFCRICEPACPMIADIENGEVIGLKPDKEHPCRGIACHKGLSYLEIHRNPDRCNEPLKRLNPKSEEQPELASLSWDEIMPELGARLASLREKYGPNSIAVYNGNPPAFDSRLLLMGGQLPDLIGTQMRFSANSQDTANKVYAAGQIYGSTMVLNVPDLPYTDYLLCVGSNPKVSRWTIMFAPNDGCASLKDIVDRGGKVRFVNPRKIEASTEETGETLRIKPGADVYFLAALLQEIYVQGGFKTDALNEKAKNIEALIDFISQYPADKVERVTGIEASEIRQVASEIMAAKSATFWMATGVNQGRQGVLTYWLNEMLALVTGNLGTRGGNYKPSGFMNMYPPNMGVEQVETGLGPIDLFQPAGFIPLPGAILPDLIEAGDIRALICIGGNPLQSIAGGDKMRAAFEKLDTLVTVDIQPTATVQMSDYQLPATDFLEREDINLLANGMQPIPYVQFTEAMTQPKFQRRDGWWIVARLVQAMGLPSPLDEDAEQDGFATINAMLAASGLSTDEIRKMPGSTAVLDNLPPEDFYNRCVIHEDGRIDCCPKAFVEGGLFSRCGEIFAEMEAEPATQLKLIGLRTPYMHNSWMGNVDKLRQGKQSGNPLYMCESDASDLELFQGDKVRITTDQGQVETTLMIDDNLRSGTVAMSHGYGHKASPSMETAASRPGVNFNAIAPSGSDTYEPLSYMSWLTGIPVNVERVSY